MKIVLAVDGSKPSLDAVDWLVEHVGWAAERPQIELVTVHLPVPKLPRMGLAVGKSQIQKYYAEEGAANLAAAKKKLDKAGVPYQEHILVGPVADTIVQHAKSTKSDLVVIGSRGMSEVGKALLGSTATKILHSSDIPVLLVK